MTWHRTGAEPLPEPMRTVPWSMALSKLRHIIRWGIMERVNIFSCWEAPKSHAHMFSQAVNSSRRSILKSQQMALWNARVKMSSASAHHDVISLAHIGIFGLQSKRMFWNMVSNKRFNFHCVCYPKAVNITLIDNKLYLGQWGTIYNHMLTNWGLKVKGHPR